VQILCPILHATAATEHNCSFEFLFVRQRSLAAMRDIISKDIRERDERLYQNHHATNDVHNGP
jgi:hypothetical protein